MRLTRHIQNFALWVMLAVVAVAYAGKALHTHSAEYYNALRTARTATTNGMSDDCPICHFNLVLFVATAVAAVALVRTLVAVVYTSQTILREKYVRRYFLLRAPPVML